MNKVIICVDDEQIILDSLKQQLSKNLPDVSIELAQSGAEAIELMHELVADGQQIAVVISDQIMPGMNGIDFLLEVDHILPETNKILLTGKTENDELVSLVNKINLYRYISKPWEEADLKLTVFEAVNAYNRERDLESKNKELNTLNNSLENKVKARTSELASKTDELELTVEELKATQNQLVLNEKLASLGQLMAGIAHEINTPLGAINASAGSLRDAFWDCIESLRKVLKILSKEKEQLFFEMVLRGTEDSSALSTKEARKKRREIANMLNGLGVERALQMADRLVDMNVLIDLEKYKCLFIDSNSESIIGCAYHLIAQTRSTRNITIGVRKASKVVQALKSYSRFSEVEKKTEVDIRENIETVLVLYHNHIKQGIDVVKNFGDSRIIISCYADELIQVWTNLVHNSIQAMKNKGELQIDIDQSDNELKVSISDNGPGIPQEIQSRIFDAFFTTKPAGEGSGLGLDIVKKIIEKHQGGISFHSDSDGTRFIVTLPKN